MASFLASWFSQTCSLDQVGEEYDFIVVGGGSAGAVVARRLSAKQDATVLLLEAGEDTSYVMDARVPAACGKMQKTDHDWAFVAEPSETKKYGTALQDNFVPRGKVAIVK